MALVARQFAGRNNSIPGTGRSARFRIVVDECQVVASEMVQPFVPGDRAERTHAWKVEPQSGAAVRDLQGRRRTGWRGFPRRGFGTDFAGPCANNLVVARRPHGRAGFQHRLARATRNLASGWCGGRLFGIEAPSGGGVKASTVLLSRPATRQEQLPMRLHDVCLHVQLKYLGDRWARTSPMRSPG